MQKIRSIIIILLSILRSSLSSSLSFLFSASALILSSCYNQADLNLSMIDSTLTDTQRDSITFINQHHYGVNYNFIITVDSVVLIKQQPEEYLEGLIIDSFAVYKDAPVVVADFKTFPTDTIDSIWLQVASSEYDSGWIHESALHDSSVPDDPISRFIKTFSDIHLLIFIIIIAVISSIYIIFHLIKSKAPLVHFNDICSFYPVSLCMLVAIAATFYTTIQKYAPDLWQEFYYHPTLNPFNTPPLLCVFLLCVWMILIDGIATIEDVFHLLPPIRACMYLLGLVAICAFNYIFFTFVSFSFVGYIMLGVYCIFSVVHHIRQRIK